MKKSRGSGRIFTALGLVMLLALFCSRENDIELVLEDSFDAPSLDRDKWGISFWPLEDGIAPEIVSSPTRAGDGAVKQIVQYRWSGEQDANRCEIQAYRQKNPRLGQHIGYFQRFDETWIGFSVYLPSDSWIPDNISRELVFQTHGSADEGEPSKSPPLSLKIDLGTTEWYWQVRWDSSRVSNSAQPTGPGAGVVDVWKGPIGKDTWTDWVLHAVWDYAADGVGFLEIWRNGEQVATRHGPNMFNDAKGMRGPIFGIYKWGWRDGPSDVTERIIYHDEFRNGDETASYSDVDPAQRD